MKLKEFVSNIFDGIGLSFMSLYDPNTAMKYIKKKISGNQCDNPYVLDDRGIPVILDLPKGLIDRIYNDSLKLGYTYTPEEWWILRDCIKSSEDIDLSVF